MTGMVSMFAGSSAPNGYLMCDGSAINRSTYSALFSVIGTIWGSGNGSTTFNLPDFRGIFPKGAGTTNREAGKNANGDFYSGTLGTYSQDRMQGHRHTASGSLLYAGGGGIHYGPLGATGGGGNQWNLANKILNPSSDTVNGTPRTGATTEPQGAGINFVIKT